MCRFEDSLFSILLVVEESGPGSPKVKLMDALSWFALGVIFFVIVTLVYGVIAIHDIPYKIAKARNHPHRDAIQAGGWISLFTLHMIWPFLWMWAYAYDPKSGYSGKAFADPSDAKTTASRPPAQTASEDAGPDPRETT